MEHIPRSRQTHPRPSKHLLELRVEISARGLASGVRDWYSTHLYRLSSGYLTQIMALEKDVQLEW